MKRLNDNELDARITNFMSRKLQEFPELEPDTISQDNIQGGRENTRNFRTTSRFGFHWHRTPHAA